MEKKHDFRDLTSSASDLSLPSWNLCLQDDLIVNTSQDFQQASSIKSQNSDTPLETEPPLNHNPEGQVTMHKELEIKFKFISPVLSKVVRHSGKRSGRYSLSYHPALTMTAL